MRLGSYVGLTTWVVFLEAVGRSATDRLEPDHLRALLEVLDAEPGGLQTEDRCSVHLRIAATTQPEALYAALSRWDRALARLDIPLLDVVRTEVLTVDEFEADFENEELLTAFATLPFPTMVTGRAGARRSCFVERSATPSPT